MTLACTMGIVIVGQGVLFMKLQSLHQDIVSLQTQNAGFELPLLKDDPEEFPSFLSQGISPAEHRNSPISQADRHDELQPPRKLEGTENAKPISASHEKSNVSKSLLTEEEKQKIWQEELRDLDAESVKDLLKIKNAIERSSKKKKN